MARTELFSRKQAGGVFTISDIARHPGSIFFVHSGTGTDGAGYGQNPDAPVATIDYAVALCTASKGDVIYVMPGHNEDLGNEQIDLDVAGISVIGLGQGLLRPRIDFGHANSSINVGASGITVKNLTLLPAITDVLVAIDVETLFTDTLIEDVEALPGEDGAGVDDFAAVVDIKVGCTRTTAATSTSWGRGSWRRSTASPRSARTSGSVAAPSSRTPSPVSRCSRGRPA
jgi:hypothetical protein